MNRKNLFQCCSLAIVMGLFLFVGTANAQAEKKFKVIGDSTWVVPTVDQNGKAIQVTSVTFEAWGAGGAGGFAYNRAGGESANGGGGGGAFVSNTIENPTGAFVISVGQGGRNIAESRTTTHGGNTTVMNDGNVVLKAVGGKSVVPTNHGTLSTNYYTFAGAQGGQASDCYPTATAVSGENGGSGSFGVLQATAGYGAAAGGSDAESGAIVAGRIARFALSGGYDGFPGKSYGGGGSGAVSYSVRLDPITHVYNGGAGANGAVRVTYTYEYTGLEAEDATFSTCSGVELSDKLNITGGNPQEMEFTYGMVGIQGVSVSHVSINYNPDEEAYIFSFNATNNNSETIPITVSCAATYHGTEVPFTVTVNVYGKLDGGNIAASSNDCSIFLTSEAPATGGSGNGSYQWYIATEQNAEGSALTAIDNATALEYTPTQSGTNYFSRIYTDEVCGTARAKNGNNNDIQVNNANTFDPGTIDEEIMTICNGEPVTKTLTANPNPSGNYSYYWQKSVDGGQTWTNIENATGNTYDVNLTADDFAGISMMEFRYTVKNAECAPVPCNGTFKVKVRNNTDYTNQFNAVNIVLWYGACDTLVEMPVLDPIATVNGPFLRENNTLVSVNRLPVGNHTIIWKVVDNCGGDGVEYEQSVTVAYPECGSKANDNLGNEYATVRVGCECWFAENLKTTMDGAVYYNEDEANAAFGKLYSWNTAMGDNTAATTKSGAEYVQGICPDGWAIPTAAQYSSLMTENMDNLKSDDENAWLSGMAGNNSTGFGLMGAGYYDATATMFQRLRGYTELWTSEEAGSTSAISMEASYGCDSIQPNSKDKENKYSVRCVRVSPAE